MSVAMTTDAVIERRKTVTLRLRVLTAATDTIARALCWALDHHDRHLSRTSKGDH